MGVPAQQEARPRVFIDTYGCQMNVLDSELVRGQLNYDTALRPEDADVVLINTCSVRALSEQKVWSQLGRLAALKAERPTLTIGVLGCMAEREGHNIVKRMPHVDIVCGPSRLDSLPQLLAAATDSGQKQVVISGHTSRRTATRDAADSLEALDLSRSLGSVVDADDPRLVGQTVRQAYVRITRGCNKFCSFCVVPYVRGPEVHRPPSHIVEEVRRLIDQGVREITLLGQTVNHYQFTEGGKSTSFADLLTLVHDQVPGMRRLRFLTSYPRDFGDDALDAMAASPRICNFLHIPAQSGSNRLLKKMNRGYTVEAYEALLERARARMPDISLAGDMIVGYASETDEDHEASLALLRRAKLKSCYVFKYSPRDGTVAAKRHADDVPEALKKARNLEMLALQGELSAQHHQRRIGQTLEVLVEGPSRDPQKAEPSAGQAGAELIQLSAARARGIGLVGRTSGDENVLFVGPKELIGTFVDVQVTSAAGLALRGTATVR